MTHVKNLMEGDGNKGIEIFLGYSCHLKCSFCFQKDLRKQEPGFIDKQEVENTILKGAKNGSTFIFFSGGEATLDKNLLGYIRFAKQHGYKHIRVHTNGLAFADKDILIQHIDAGMTGVILSIHGYGKVHDVLVGMDGAFKKVTQTLSHLYNVRKEIPNFAIDTNTALTRVNKNNLHALFKFLSYFPIMRCQLTQLYSLQLFSYKEKESLYVPYSEFEQELDSILALKNINITLERFPFCRTKNKHWRHIEERYRSNNDAYGNIGGGEGSVSAYLEGCEKCIKRGVCNGIPRDYLEVFPDESFSPIVSI